MVDTKNGVAIFEKGQHPRDIRKAVEAKEVKYTPVVHSGVVTTAPKEEVVAKPEVEQPKNVESKNVRVRPLNKASHLPISTKQ